MASHPVSPKPSEAEQPSRDIALDQNAPEPSPDRPDDDVRDHDDASKSPTGSSRSKESGEASPVAPQALTPNKPEAPPVPQEPLPGEDDGWDCHWDASQNAWFFFNRYTNQSTWDNPRVSKAGPAAPQEVSQLQTPPNTAVPPQLERPPAGGYNPAIHGDYDPNAWYAQNSGEAAESEGAPTDAAAAYAAMGNFNRFTGQWQASDQNPDRHNDESKSRRQMNAFFDVDAAANLHDGRSLKAERSGKKPSKSELKHFKEKRKARKEEKRRAWLRD
ncbi:hypothetical protein GGR56DRAFT_272445 [Xylariaceae sp. FL0804]|nr:hypothetical protein GGR56DRAFT_272445 [Xylariaceae sp. FL0804]